MKPYFKSQFRYFFLMFNINIYKLLFTQTKTKITKPSFMLAKPVCGTIAPHSRYSFHVPGLPGRVVVQPETLRREEGTAQIIRDLFIHLCNSTVQ